MSIPPLYTFRSLNFLPREGSNYIDTSCTSNKDGAQLTYSPSILDGRNAINIADVRMKVSDDKVFQLENRIRKADRGNDAVNHSSKVPRIFAIPSKPFRKSTSTMFAIGPVDRLRVAYGVDSRYYKVH